KAGISALLDSAFDKHHRMTAKTCAVLEKTATWLNLTGVRLPRNLDERKQLGIDFSTWREYTRTLVAALAAGMRGGAHLRRVSEVTELGYECMNAYHALNRLSSEMFDFFDFKLALKYGN